MLAVLGRSWGLCWQSWGAPGDHAGGLGPLLELMLAVFGRSWNLCWRSWVVLGPKWSVLGPMLAVLGPVRIVGARKVEKLLFPSGKARFWEVREAAPELRKRG